VKTIKATLTSEIVVNASADGEPNATPSFGGVAYSGGVVSRASLNKPLDADYIIDLSDFNTGRNVKVNLDHKPSQRVGHLTEAASDGKQLSVSGLLSAATTHQQEVAESARRGYGWEVSIEAVLTNPRKIATGKTETINGRLVAGPVYVFKGKLTGLGFVSNGADHGNSITVAATAAGASTMSDFEKFAASLGVDLETATDDQKANLQNVFKAKQTTEPTDSFATSVDEIAKSARERKQHFNRIAEITRAAMSDHPQYVDQIEALAKAAVESQTDPDKFELELIRATRSKKGQFAAQMNGTSNDPKVLEAALAMASGLPDVEKHYNEKVLDAVDRNGLSRGFSIQSMLMQQAHANGYTCRPGERIHVGNLHEVLEYALPPRGFRAHLSGFSAASLPNILGAVANKMILSGYMEEDSTWKEIAEIKPVSNFYTQNHYRMLDSLEYEEVGSGGEIKHGTLGEETYTSQAKTYGKMLGITRTQIINDDLGAFNDLRTRLGRGAAQKFGNVFWTAFINNSSFYTLALTNYIEGSTTNLGTDGVGLGLMVKAFRTMTTPAADGSKKIGMGLNPTKILVPPELEGNAILAYTASNVANVATSSGNIYAGRFRPVVQWRLSNSSYTGYSTTAYYLFGDTVKPMLVTFLNGQQSPTVESTDADFNTLGIQFRGYHDFGCDKSEYLAGVKSKGAT
jgi:hypothetical protein